MTLFELTHTRRTDPETSRKAARSVESDVARQCRIVLEILERGPIDGKQLRLLCLQAGIANLTARTSDLRKRGHVIVVEDGVYRLADATHNV